MRGATESLGEEAPSRLTSYSLDQASVEVYWITPKGKFVYTNKKTRERLGYSKEELENMHVWEVDPNHGKEVREDRWKELKEKRSMTFESEHKTKDREVYPVEINNHYIEFKRREYEFSFAKEITKRKKAEKKLKEKHRLLKTLFSNLPGIAYRCLNDKDWTMQFLSEGCKDLTEYNRGDLVNNNKLSYGELIVPEDRKKVWKEVQSAIEKREPFKVSYRIETKSGEIKWVWEQGRGIFSEDDELKFLEGFITDITEKKRRKEKLRESEKKYRELFESAKVAIVVYGPEKKIISANPTAERSLGLEEGELKNKSLEYWEGIILKKNGEPMSKDEFPVSRVYDSKQLIEGEIIGISLPTKEEIKWYIVSVVPHLDEDKKIKRVITSFDEITKQKELKERKDFLNTLLRQDLASKHQNIQGYLQLLMDTDLTEKQRKYLRKAVKTGRETGETLTLAKELEEIEKADWVSKKDPLKISEHVLDNISNLAERKGIEIKKDYPEEINKVNGDYSLSNLFTQILKTRIQSQNCNKIRIEIEDKDGKIQLITKDDGKRLAEDIKNLFSGKVYRGITAGAGGARYYMIREIAKHNDAKIKVKDSELGGARFDVFLKKA